MSVKLSVANAAPNANRLLHLPKFSKKNPMIFYLWLADQIIEVIKNEKELAGKALIVTQKYLKK
ncbi:MAG: hypothetical protein LBB41_03315 [Prevotellaceae bacterium]|jgi:hypothetical protein|nr:hypothetical protein [Prevotellaceae bacterium]